MQMTRMFICGVLLTVFTSAVAIANDNSNSTWPPFETSEINSKAYSASVGEFIHGQVTIRIAQIKHLDGNYKSVPHFCGAWIQVIKGNNVLWQTHFKDIDPVGASYGLFIPNPQPSAELFAVIKEGDYDGHLFLIQKDGAVINVMGGKYLLSANHDLIVSIYSSDESGIAVVDAHNGKIMLSTKNLPNIYQWYQKESVYYFGEAVWLPEYAGTATEKQNVVYLNRSR
jgi:hypothetical protein